MNLPKRIQRKRTKGWRMPAGAVYVGRPTKWGNPFYAVERFRAWLEWHANAQPEMAETYLAPIRGKDLACWCPLDQPCHADVLIELANATTDPVCGRGQ